MLITGLFLSINTFASTSIPYVTKVIVNQYDEFGKWGFVSFTLFYGFLWMIPKISLALADLIFFPLTNDVIRKVNVKLLNHVHNIDLQKYEKLKIAEVSSSARRIADSARSYINSIVLKITPAFARMVISGYILVTYSVVGLGIILILMLNYCAVYFFLKKYIKSRKIAWHATDKASGLVIDSMINTLIARFHKNFEFKRINASFQAEAKLWKEANVDLQILNISRNIFKGISLMIVLPVSAALLKSGVIEIGGLIMIKGYVLSMFSASKTVFRNCKKIMDASCDVEKVVQILDVPEMKFGYKNLKFKDIEKLPIILDQVNFKYPGQTQNVLEDLSMEIRHGDKILISGPNGGGKSTLCNIMCGLYAPVSGSAQVGEYELSKINPLLLGQKIDYIPQNSNLYLPRSSESANIVAVDSSIPKNIALYGKKAGDFNDNLTTLISAGEKQSIMLLQVLASSRADIVILDEATSNLSRNLEMDFIEEIIKIIPTVILISHRKIQSSAFTKQYALKGKNLRLIEK